MGPTGAGKSAVAMAVAESTGADIVSIDSMQVYRGMDIGTAKATPEDRRRVAHHMLDVADPAQDYSAARFQAEARAIVKSTERPVLLVGGSGLHFRSIVDPLEFAPFDRSVRNEVAALDEGERRRLLLALDGEATFHVDLENPRRVARSLEIARMTGALPSDRARRSVAAAVREYKPILPVVAVGVDPGEGLGERIARRFDVMLGAGLVDEVRSLMGSWGTTASQAVGYRQIADALRSGSRLDGARERSILATRRLAKRQRTFFRRDPRVVWLEWSDSIDDLAGRATEVFGEAGWSS